MSDTEGSVDDPGVPLARNTGHEWRVREVKRKRNSGAWALRVVMAVLTLLLCLLSILHQQFWAIGDFGLQNAYIQKNVHLMPSKRRRAVQNPTADLHHQW